MIEFDVISDLNVGSKKKFSWTHKNINAYCIVAGNISSDVQGVFNVLDELSAHYLSVFYIPGPLEYQGLETAEDLNQRTDELVEICNYLENVNILINNIATLSGVAIVGINGWGEPNPHDLESEFNFERLAKQDDDLFYLGKSIEKLQIHGDIRKIIVASGGAMVNGVNAIDYTNDFSECLNYDTEKKISHWILGSCKEEVNMIDNDIHFFSSNKKIQKLKVEI